MLVKVSRTVCCIEFSSLSLLYSRGFEEIKTNQFQIISEGVLLFVIKEENAVYVYHKDGFIGAISKNVVEVISE